MSDHTTVTFTFAVAGPTGSGIAVLPSDGGLALPTVDIPARVWFPDVESVLGALRDKHRIEAFALDCLDDRRDPDSPSVEICYLVELRPGFAMPAATRWGCPPWTRRSTCCSARTP